MLCGLYKLINSIACAHIPIGTVRLNKFEVTDAATCCAVVLLFNVHGEQLWSHRDGQLT